MGHEYNIIMFGYFDQNFFVKSSTVLKSSNNCSFFLFVVLQHAVNNIYLSIIIIYYKIMSILLNCSRYNKYAT